MGQEGTGVQCRILAEIRHGQGARRRLHLYRPDRAPVLHGQERVDAGAVWLDLRLSVHRLRHPAGVAGGQQELSGLHGEALHQPGGGRPDVLHRHRRRQAAAPAPLLLLRGLLRPGVLRGHGGQGVPGAGPPGL